MVPDPVKRAATVPVLKAMVPDPAQVAQDRATTDLLQARMAARRMTNRLRAIRVALAQAISLRRATKVLGKALDKDQDRAIRDRRDIRPAIKTKALCRPQDRGRRTSHRLTTDG